MKAPTSCHLWSCETLKSEDLRNLEQVESFVDESHLVRSLVRCQSCGQLYFKEWLEFIGYLIGSREDPVYITLVPVETRDEIEQLKRTTSEELTQFRPQLRSDWPSDADQPRIYWVRGDT